MYVRVDNPNAVHPSSVHTPSAFGSSQATPRPNRGDFRPLKSLPSGRLRRKLLAISTHPCEILPKRSWSTGRPHPPFRGRLHLQRGPESAELRRFRTHCHCRHTRVFPLGRSVSPCAEEQHFEIRRAGINHFFQFYVWTRPRRTLRLSVFRWRRTVKPDSKIFQVLRQHRVQRHRY